MITPPPPSAADMAAAASLSDHHDILAEEEEEEEEEDFEEEDDDDDIDMQVDDDVDIPTVPAAGEDLNSSPSSSTDDDDELRNPSRVGVHLSNFTNPANESPLVSVNASRNGGGTLQPVPISSFVPGMTGAAECFETPEAKRQRTEGSGASEERRSFASLEDSRRLFQRLWTDEDEIIILQGYYDFTWRRGTTHHAHQHDTGPFYEQIKSRLQLDFTKNQLVEKIRRLKKKYRNVLTRMASGRDFAFKSPHDQATFEISRKIWSSTPSRGGFDCDDDDNGNEREHAEVQKEQKRRKRRRRRSADLATVAAVGAGPEVVPVEVKSVPALLTTPMDVKSIPLLTATQVEIKSIPALTTTPVEVKSVPALTNKPSFAVPASAPSLVNSDVVEETVKSCLAPLFKELLSCAISGPLALGTAGGSPMALGLVPVGFLGNLPVTGAKDAVSEGKWRKQQISELEVYSKRLELVQEQIKSALEELRSSE